MNYKKFLLLIILITSTVAVFGADKLKVFYAGISFTGNNNSIPLNYPYSSAICSKASDDEDTPFILDTTVLDTEMRKRVAGVNPKSFVLDKSGKKANLKKGDAIAMTLSIDRETVLERQLKNSVSVTIWLSAQIMFFDFQEKTIIGSFPFLIKLSGTTDKLEDKKYISEKFNQLFFTEEAGVNFFDEAKSSMEKLNLKAKYKSRMQVTEVLVEEKALHALPKGWGKDGDQELTRSFVAQSFSSYLSKNQNISILPYVPKSMAKGKLSSGGQAFGKLVATFGNSEVYTMRIPEPDYPIILTLRGFKKAKYKDEGKAIGSTWLYGSYANVKFMKPFGSKSYMNENLKNAQTQLIRSTQSMESLNEWPFFVNSLLVLFDTFTKQFPKADKKWCKEHGYSKDLYKTIKITNEILEKCK